MNKPREYSRCGCGASIDLVSGEDCQNCTTAKYTEVWSHRVSPEFRDFKALMFGALFLLISLPCYGNSKVSPTVNMEALCEVESGCRSFAIGDGGRALGAFQLHAGAVKDVNSLLKTNYSHDEAMDEAKGRAIADAYVNKVIPHYLRHYRLPDTLENRLTAYNRGLKAVKKGQTASAYIQRYRESL